jgi:hypothetical protein
MLIATRPPIAPDTGATSNDVASLGNARTGRQVDQWNPAVYALLELCARAFDVIRIIGTSFGQIDPRQRYMEEAPFLRGYRFGE